MYSGLVDDHELRKKYSDYSCKNPNRRLHNLKLIKMEGTMLLRFVIFNLLRLLISSWILTILACKKLIKESLKTKNNLPILWSRVRRVAMCPSVLPTADDADEGTTPHVERRWKLPSSVDGA